MKCILLVPFFLFFFNSTNDSVENEIEKFITQTGGTSITHENFYAIFKKVKLSKFELKELIIYETKADLGSVSVEVCILSKEKNRKYYFFKSYGEESIKFSAKEKIYMKIEECSTEYADGINEKIMYIFPFENGKIVVDSAKYIICQKKKW